MNANPAICSPGCFLGCGGRLVKKVMAVSSGIKRTNNERKVYAQMAEF